MTRSWFCTRTIPTHQHIPVCFSLFGLACLLLAGLVGCDEGPTGGGKVGTEYTFIISIPDGDTDVPLYPTLGWTIPQLMNHSDAEGPVFDVYFGRGVNPRLVAQGITEMHYHAGPLDFGQEYHWRVVVRGEAGQSSSSPVWSFTTADDFRYPLADGNLWRYELAVTHGDYQESRDYRVIAWSPVDCPDSCSLYQVDWSYGDPEVQSGSALYLQADSGLYAQYGYVGDMVMPKTSPTGDYLIWQGRTYTSLAELVLEFSEFKSAGSTMRSPAAGSWFTVLDYPLEAGKTWLFRPPPERIGDWIIDKEITRAELEIATDAGTFPCYEIHWRYDKDRDGEYEDDIRVVEYVGPVGLVRRDIQIEGLYRYDYEGNLICRCTFETVQKLTEFVLR